MTSFVNFTSSKVFPDITKDASLANCTPVALDTKGTVRDALGLASKIYTWGE